MTRTIAVQSLARSARTPIPNASLRRLRPKRRRTSASTLLQIGDLPLYNPDLDGATPPAAWTAFRARIKSADAVLFVTPEYNRSVPGVLKNAIDVGSRPYGQSAFAGKPAAVVSSSIGPISGFGANHHLRQSLAFLDMPTLQQPEVYLASVVTTGSTRMARLKNDEDARLPRQVRADIRGLDRADRAAQLNFTSRREAEVRLRGRRRPAPHFFAASRRRRRLRGAGHTPPAAGRCPS